MQIRRISLLGHKDHGKSTLIGSLLMQTGAATQVRINEATAYSKRLKKDFEPAFILDSFAEEREGGMTYDTTRAQIMYKNLAFELIDVPGHEELIKNMISGASYGELAILLVSAKEDEGVRDQTKRHLFLAKMLGIKKIVVAVNKMDSVAYSKARFEEIKSGLHEFLHGIGYKNSEIEFVPISAYNADNLIKKSSNMRWYGGKSMMDTISGMVLSKADDSSTNELRIITQGVIPDDNGPLVTGKVASGKLHLGDKVMIVPSGKSYSVKELFVKAKKVKVAKTGENIAIRLNGKADANLRGSVIYKASKNLKPTNKLHALVFITKRLGPHTNFRFIGAELDARIKVLNLVDTVTGKVIKSKKVDPLNAANVEIRLNKSIPAEPFEKSAELGRFTLYNKKEFSGIGIIKDR